MFEYKVKSLKQGGGEYENRISEERIRALWKGKIYDWGAVEMTLKAKHIQWRQKQSITRSFPPRPLTAPLQVNACAYRRDELGVYELSSWSKKGE